MKFFLSFFLFSGLTFAGKALGEKPGFEGRILHYIDSMHVVDTHEHLFTPEIIKGSSFQDFMLLFQQNGYDDLVAAMMPVTLFDTLFNEPLSPVVKWKIIEPYYRNTFNTSYMKILLQGIRNLYGINDLNEHTVSLISDEVKKTYTTSRFDRILKDSAKIDFIIQDGYYMPGKDDYFRYAKRFDNWINVKSNYTIDSIAISQVEPIYTLDDYEKSLRLAFEESLKKGMTVVKVALAYSRTLKFDKTGREPALKVFRKLVNGNEDLKISFNEAKPLQDYMFYRLMDLANEYGLPVAIHTGLQADRGNTLSNSDPLLLTNVFRDFPDVRFVLYHGSYPYGGELSALAKSYRNVFIDLNWMYSISPSYSERYLNEFLETIPVSKIMAFGGDCMAVENVYSELITAKRIISEVLIKKVQEGYITEDEAKTIARMILHDNAIRFYKLN
ncbi:MAG TPA: amidohydrolase family protein [Bacteroidales bacterium]|nr:amidohydrolase family protein [Bacteroidales bacterium]